MQFCLINKLNSILPDGACILAVQMYEEDVATLDRLYQSERQIDERVLVTDKQAIVGEDDHALGRVVQV